MLELQVTPADKCRWLVAAIVSAGKHNYLSDNYRQQLRNWGYATVKVPEVRRAVRARHPFTTRLSPMLAPLRVYSKMAKFVEVSSISYRYRL